MEFQRKSCPRQRKPESITSRCRRDAKYNKELAQAQTMVGLGKIWTLLWEPTYIVGAAPLIATPLPLPPNTKRNGSNLPIPTKMGIQKKSYHIRVSRGAKSNIACLSPTSCACLLKSSSVDAHEHSIQV